MGSRSKWEDMVGQAKYILGVDDSQTTDQKPTSDTSSDNKNTADDKKTMLDKIIDKQVDGN